MVFKREFCSFVVGAIVVVVVLVGLPTSRRLNYSRVTVPKYETQVNILGNIIKIETGVSKLTIKFCVMRTDILL